MGSMKWWLLVAALAAGCGSDKTADNKIPGADAAVPAADMSSDDGARPDASEPAPDMPDAGGVEPDAGEPFVPVGCPDGVNADVTIDLDAGAQAGQFYARAAWDGSGAWVVYNRRGSAGDMAPEEIFVVRVGCDGTIERPATQLSETNGARKYMPVIASRGGVTHVAWVEEQNGSAGAIRLMLLDSAGSQLLGAPTDVTPTGPDEPVSTLTWEPDVAALADGSGVVAVSAGNASEFRVVLQRYDALGVRVGNALTPHTDKGVDQLRPSLAAGADGTLYVAWTLYKPADAAAGTPEEPERAVFTSIPAGADMAFPAVPMPAKPLAEPNPIARFSREPGPGGAHFLAFQVTEASAQSILVRDGTNFATAATGTFGSAGWANFRPSVAGGETGGVLAWYRYNQSPLRNSVMLHPFTFVGGAVTPGSEIEIATTTPAIPPYGPDVTWAGGANYFVVWGEGESAPMARVKGRWVVVD